MSTYLLTGKKSLAEVVRLGLKTKVFYHFTETGEVLSRLIENGHCERSLIILDLATIPDAEHFITFVKSSASIREIPIIGIGRTEDYDPLEGRVLSGLTWLLHHPCTADEIAAMEARVLGEPNFP